VPPPPPFVAHSGGTAPTLLAPGVAARAQADRPSRKALLIAAPLLLAILAVGVVFALAHRGPTHPTPSSVGKGTGEGPVPPAPSPQPPPAAGRGQGEGAPLTPDFAAKGDEAFAAARYDEALENYAKALAARPDNAELKAKSARAEEARKCEAAMQAAQALEERGDLEAAAAKYDEAMAFDRGTKARERLERVRAEIGKNQGLNAAQRNAELDAISAKAEEAERAVDFGAAAQHYSRAASLAEGNLKTVFADKARECRRQEYQAKAMAAEELQNYAEAERWYGKALELKPDPLLAQKVEALQQKMKPATDAAFEAALREGQKALEAGDFAKSRKQFNAALSLKPGSQDAAAKLKEVDGRELFAKGDAFRAAGNLGDALSLYTEALQKCPALATLATARIQALDSAKVAPLPAPPPAAGRGQGEGAEGGPRDTPAAVSAKVDALVLAQKNTEALAEAVAATRSSPDSKELKELKTSLESVLACTDLYAELQKTVEAGLSRVRDVRDIDDDDRAREWRDGLEKLRDLFTAQARKPRPLFLAHNYQGVQGCLVSARADALELASQLGTVADGCDRKADKAAEKGTGVKGPFGFSLGLGGDKKKAEKYRNLCESFRKLAEQARAQSK